MRLKKATRYRSPKYPVMESGEVVSVPREVRLGDLALGLARPIAPIVLSAGLGYSVAGASPGDGRPAVVRPLIPATVAAAVQEKQEGPYRVRLFTEQEIQSLLRELQIEYKYPENVRGRVALRTPPLTEAQGRAILARFFARNRIGLREGVRFQKGGVDFTPDGYDPEKKIGFEFVPDTGEEDLTADELAALERGIEGEHLLVLRGAGGYLPKPRDVVVQIEKAAKLFLEKLYRDGALGRAREIERHTDDLLSDDGAKSARAADALRKIGPEALWWLRKHGEDARVAPIIRGIYEEHVRPALDALEDDRLEVRDDATEKLIGFGPAVASYVEERLRQTKGDSEVQARCEYILKALREERP
ncbi:MAG: hypothetical protein HYY17_10840 [Planctomycetes bacterium]|nr:hypothetical protein [Planctomycetota bacterium]